MESVPISYPALHPFLRCGCYLDAPTICFMSSKTCFGMGHAIPGLFEAQAVSLRVPLLSQAS